MKLTKRQMDFKEVEAMSNLSQQKRKEMLEHLNRLKEININDETLKAIEEGRALAKDPNAKSYDNIDDLKKALGV